MSTWGRGFSTLAEGLHGENIYFKNYVEFVIFVIVDFVSLTLYLAYDRIGLCFFSAI